MEKVLSFSFDQRFGPFTILLVEGLLQRHFLDIYLTTFFGVRKFKNASAMRVIFFGKCSKLNLNLENDKKKFENIFRFSDNCIWKCCYRLSLSIREYLLLAVNGLTNSAEILHITQWDFSTWISFTGTNKYGKGAAVQLWTVFWPVYHVTCRRVLWNGTF